MRVLLVEADDILAAAVAEALGDDGHVVAIAGSHADGLRCSDAEPWDVIVVNAFNPAAFRAPTPAERTALQRFSARAPVIVVSAVDWIRQLSAADLGVAAAIAKPFELAELLVAAELLGGHPGTRD